MVIEITGNRGFDAHHTASCRIIIGWVELVLGERIIGCMEECDTLGGKQVSLSAVLSRSEGSHRLALVPQTCQDFAVVRIVGPNTPAVWQTRLRIQFSGVPTRVSRLTKWPAKKTAVAVFERPIIDDCNAPEPASANVVSEPIGRDEFWIEKVNMDEEGYRQKFSDSKDYIKYPIVLLVDLERPGGCQSQWPIYDTPAKEREHMVWNKARYDNNSHETDSSYDNVPQTHCNDICVFRSLSFRISEGLFIHLGKQPYAKQNHKGKQVKMTALFRRSTQHSLQSSFFHRQKDLFVQLQLGFIIEFVALGQIFERLAQNPHLQALLFRIDGIFRRNGRFLFGGVM